MATIEQNIARITQAKADIKTAIEAKGVTVDSAATIDAYADYVDDIPTGGGGENRLNMLLKDEITAVTAADLSGVTNIGYGKFYGCTHLKSFDFSNITGISNYAFSSCGLESANLSSVTSIGSDAFNTVPSLTSVTLSNSISAIQASTFANTNIINFTIPTGVTRLLGYSCPANAYYFESTTPPQLSSNAITSRVTIYVPSGAVDTYKSSWSAYSDYIVAYPATGRSEIHYTTTDGEVVKPNQWLYGDWLYSNTYDSNNKGIMTFGNLLKYTGSYRGSANLETIEFPEGVTESIKYMLHSCNTIKEVVFPSTMSKLESFTLYFNQNLTSVTFKGTTPPALSGNNQLGTNTLIYVPAEAVETYKTAWTNWASRIQAIPTP